MFYTARLWMPPAITIEASLKFVRVMAIERTDCGRVDHAKFAPCTRKSSWHKVLRGIP